MSFDIYGGRLRSGYCEVHPDVAESYPCSVCMMEQDLRRGPEIEGPSEEDYIEGHCGSGGHTLYADAAIYDGVPRCYCGVRKDFTVAEIEASGVNFRDHDPDADPTTNEDANPSVFNSGEARGA